MWIVKFIAGAIGLAVAGIFSFFLVIAGIFGLVLGLLGRSLGGAMNPAGAARRQEINDMFFRTTFLLMGKLAKADGRISEREVAHTEQLMSHMGLHSEHRRQAIALFKEGSQPDFDIAPQLRSFRNTCARYPALSRQLLHYLLSLALADGTFGTAEEAILRQVAQELDINAALFDQLVRMIRAQAHFRGHGGGYTPPPRSSTASELALAYEALGVESSVSDAELKRTYRKLMSENHPDKLMGQGVPEDMVKLATERVQEIQTAYELIRKYRQNH